MFGSLGVTNLTPLQHMWTGVPTQFIMDGPNEVHKVTIARNVLKGYEPHQGNWPSEFLPAKRAEAKKEALAALEIAPSFERAQELLLNSVGG